MTLMDIESKLLVMWTGRQMFQLLSQFILYNSQFL